MKTEYSSPIGLTSQFRFCPNAFRVDMYKGCGFGCKYCFSNITNAHGHQGFGEAKIEKIKRLFSRAFESDEDTNSLTVELLRNRVPLHCGGKSDPFQQREWDTGLTYKLIEISNEYNYPICFSTKTANLPDRYFNILNPDIHAFQSSILGLSDSFSKAWETNTPTPRERVEFVKRLRDLGFWCSIRIQPLIDIDEALSLVSYVGNIPSYITVEHLKLLADNNAALFKLPKIYENIPFEKSPYNMRNLEIREDIKISNIDRIKKEANKNGVLVGVGDNDLHNLSQSRCCCGIDTINQYFSNYLKYNLIYFCTAKDNEIDFDSLWCPVQSVSDCFYSEKGNKVNPSYVENVNKYIKDNIELLNNKHAEKYVLGCSRIRLF